MNVLILGNGISRLSFDDYIRSFDGQIWGCNYVFQEYASILDRLTGHQEPMDDADELKKKHGHRYEIFAGVLCKNKSWKKFTVHPRWLRDSGTTMVAQALHEGFEVWVCGFDLGGPDVYYHDQYLTDKTVWVHRWAEMFREWGWERVHFVGHDHSPFIREVMDAPHMAGRYSKRYKSRNPHIKDTSYTVLYSDIMGERRRIMADKVTVIFPNGYSTQIDSELAQRMVNKGECQFFVQSPKKEEPTPAKVTAVKEEKKEESAKIKVGK